MPCAVQALAQFEPLFRAETSKTDWGAAAVHKGTGNAGVAAKVLVTPYAIGYSVLAEALLSRQPVARLKKPTGRVVAASSQVPHRVAQRPADRSPGEIQGSPGLYLRISLMKDSP